ncbi:Protein U5 [Labeo rohita]|uniref:Protein U5 n=1 Tax=Labeo rohita TaxID=84645 RepID=A0ABQ8ME05_LABRO|nr:Protein U5 [Labeo rohita]
MANLCPPLSACEDTFELHSLQLELEAVEKQIQELLVRQTELRERRAALESSRVYVSQAPAEDLAPSAASGLRDLQSELLRSPPRDGTRRCDRRRLHCPLKVHTHCLPGARVLHVGVHDTKLRQTEVLKRDFSSLIEMIRSTSPATRIIVSGPLPTYRCGHESYCV